MSKTPEGEHSVMAAIIEQFHIPRELTVEFLGTFARFEYALKRAGYVEGDDKSVAADWDRFGRDVAAISPEALACMVASCPYLQDHPPKKQVLRDGGLVWKTRGASGGTVIQEILLSVRTVRNNVFHGGKFPEGPVAEPLRDERLIRDCLAVLNSLLDSPRLPGGIADYFRPEG
jgi:hypothetical protein